MSDFESSPLREVEIILDGLPIELPPERQSFTAIRSYLESLALQQQRILCSLNIDGEPVNLTAPRHSTKPFARVDAETMALQEVPAQLIRAARAQTVASRTRVQTAIELVLINDHARGCELWWELSTGLKEPLLTLSLLPENICGPANGSASMTQLRKWQLQQLGCVIQDIDEVCRFEDPVALSDALETRALPWLNNLHESLSMWLESIDPESQPSVKSA